MLFLYTVLSLFFVVSAEASELIFNNTPARVCFSPEGSCTKVITNEISSASKEILVQAFSFTSSRIQKALVAAKTRGITVEVICDEKKQIDEKYRAAGILSRAGIPVLIDDKHTSAHDKIMIIDRETVITGSFNFTNAAERKNAENVLILKSPQLAALYVDNWLKHKKHSRKY